MDEDDRIDQLFIQHRRHRSNTRRSPKQTRKSQRKHIYRAYWLTPSFTKIAIHNIARREVFFVGSHRPGVIHGLDFPPTPVFATIGNDFREAIPMEHDQFPRLVAALIQASNDPEVHKKTQSITNILTRYPKERMYVEFDFNTIPYENIVQEVNETWRVDTLRTSHLAWLENAFCYNVRTVKDHNQVKIQQLILIGRDVQNLVPVIALVKPRYNFYHIIPLADGGINLITSLKLLIYYRPHSEFAITSADKFEKDVVSELQKLRTRFNFIEPPPNTPMNKIIKMLEI